MARDSQFLAQDPFTGGVRQRGNSPFINMTLKKFRANKTLAPLKVISNKANHFMEPPPDFILCKRGFSCLGCKGLCKPPAKTNSWMKAVKTSSKDLRGDDNTAEKAQFRLSVLRSNSNFASQHRAGFLHCYLCWKNMLWSSAVFMGGGKQESCFHTRPLLSSSLTIP